MVRSERRCFLSICDVGYWLISCVLLLVGSKVNFEKVWEDMQPPLVSLVSGLPQTLTNEKWLEMYS